MGYVEVNTQAALDKALAELQPGEIIVLDGNGYFDISNAPRVEAWKSSSPTVVARGSSKVSGNAGKYAAITAISYEASIINIMGAILLPSTVITTAEEWCDYYGVEVENGIATLYKAVRADFGSIHEAAFKYTPGSVPEAPEWDPIPECGFGLHFSPTPLHAQDMSPTATRFVACPVALVDIVVHQGAEYPQKVKAPRLAAPCYEVDRLGKPVDAQAGGTRW